MNLINILMKKASKFSLPFIERMFSEEDGPDPFLTWPVEYGEVISHSPNIKWVYKDDPLEVSVRIPERNTLYVYMSLVDVTSSVATMIEQDYWSISISRVNGAVQITSKNEK